MDEFEKIDVSDLVDELPESRVLVAYERAVRELGHEPDAEEADGDEFAELFSIELRKMIAADIVGALLDDGLVDARLGEDGELTYTLSEKGEQELE